MCERANELPKSNAVKKVRNNLKEKNNFRLETGSLIFLLKKSNSFLRLNSFMSSWDEKKKEELREPTEELQFGLWITTESVSRR